MVNLVPPFISGGTTKLLNRIVEKVDLSAIYEYYSYEGITRQASTRAGSKGIG